MEGKGTSMIARKNGNKGLYGEEKIYECITGTATIFPSAMRDPSKQPQVGKMIKAWKRIVPALMGRENGYKGLSMGLKGYKNA